MVTSALPPLREELTLHPAPAAAHGAPTWSLQDPVGNRFFRIDWPTFLILTHWHLGDMDQICAAVTHQAPLELTSEDVQTVLKFLADSELLQSFDSRGTRRLLATQQRRRESWWNWLLHRYLSFRIPLLRPDAWLTRMLPHVDFFYSGAFLKITVAALLLGLFETARQWPHFTATFLDTLSWKGVLSYALVLIAVKTLHELGHAFTAKRYGCRVPTMGVAFLVMWPVAYTDVNDTWKLPDRRQRLAVSAAGVVTELAVAAWATLAWSLLPDGTLRNGAFMLAAVTWISTVAVNASPFMRFDGYFLLSDWLDIPNLHARAFALARWRLRGLLFGLDEEPPEHFPKARARFLILFAWITWVYRLVLFLGIAVLVYRHFFKALGVVLFLVEIAWFVALPLSQELREWRIRWPAIRGSRRARYTGALLATALVLGFVPLDPRVASQGVLKPARSMNIYAPQAGILTAAPRKKHGDAVAAGEPLLQMSSPEQNQQEALARIRLARIKAQLAAATLDGITQDELPVLRESGVAIESELAGYESDHARLAPQAPFAGVWVDPQPDLHTGDPIARNEPLGTLIDPTSWEVKTYLDERDVLRVAVGDTALFYPETSGLPAIELKVTNIDRDASRELPEPLLASTAGGQVAVRPTRSPAAPAALIPETAIYGVTLAAIGTRSATALREQRGHVVIRGQARTLMGKYLETAASVVIRESGG